MFADQLTPRQLRRTPEWVDESAPAEINSQIDVFSEPFPASFSEQSLPSKIDATPKAKIKTRGVPSANIDVYSPDINEYNIRPPNMTNLPEEAAGEPVTYSLSSALILQERVTIKVSKRAYEMFGMIFRTENQELPGEIPWTEFLHGMSSAGFSIEKQYGSAWLFTPPNPALRSITFHEPHPSTKIPIHIARRHAWRLTNAYGWTARTFELKR